MFRKTALSLLLAAAFAAPAADAPAHRATHPLDIAQAIELVARDYPGQAIAAQVDPVAGDSVHYHVDVLFPTGKMARLDVDSRTRLIVSRMPPEDPVGAPPLVDAVRAVEARSRGRVVFAEIDLAPRPHYHMNVRLRSGRIARYDFEFETRHVVVHPLH